MSDEFSVFEIVKKLRTMRPAMVQARVRFLLYPLCRTVHCNHATLSPSSLQDQYHFVYQAVSILAKNFLEGNTTLQKPPLPAAKVCASIH